MIACDGHVGSPIAALGRHCQIAGVDVGIEHAAGDVLLDRPQAHSLRHGQDERGQGVELGSDDVAPVAGFDT
jgi:hypothetical protein